MTEPEITHALIGLTSAVTHLTTEVVRMAAVQVSMQTTLTELKTDVAGLRAGMVEVKADVAELKTDVAGLKADMVEVKADVADLKRSGEEWVSETREMLIVFHKDLCARIDARLGPAAG